MNTEFSQADLFMKCVSSRKNKEKGGLLQKGGIWAKCYRFTARRKMCEDIRFSSSVIISLFYPTVIKSSVVFPYISHSSTSPYFPKILFSSLFFQLHCLVTASL